MPTLIQVSLEGSPDTLAQRASLVQQTASFRHLFVAAAEGSAFRVTVLPPDGLVERAAFVGACLEALLQTAEDTLDPPHLAAVLAILHQHL